MTKLNTKWVPQNNQLVSARDRGRLGDNSVIQTTGTPIASVIPSMVPPIRRKLVSPLVRKMGETTIEQRRYGSRSLWGGTPLAEIEPTVGDPNIFDVGEELKDWDRVGWYWDRPQNRLCVYLTKGENTYVVNIPWKKVRAMLSRLVCDMGGAPIMEPTVNGFFRNVSRKIKSAATSPVRLVKNPKKFVAESARKLRATARDVGKVALNVASHPAFAGVMTAMAVTPPLQAVGGAGLAAYAAARKAKPAIEAALIADKQLERATNRRGKKKGRPIDKGKAAAVVNNMRTGMPQLPGPMRNMLGAALKSQTSSPTRPRFRYSPGQIRQVR
jgi:hypothetical protein